MNAEELLAEVEALGVSVDLDGNVLRFRPGSSIPKDLVDELRAHKPQLVELVSLRDWPEESREAVRRFQKPEARLYPFVGHTVATPEGTGRLLVVLPDLAAVRIRRPPRRTIVVLPSEVRPLGVTRGRDLSFEAVH